MAVVKRETVKFVTGAMCEFGGGIIAGGIIGSTLMLNALSPIKKASVYTAGTGLGLRMGRIAEEELNEVIDAVYDIIESVKGGVKYGKTGDEFVYESEARETEA